MINMINPNDVQTNLEALANTIQGNDPQGANRLRNLRSAVGRGSGNSADAWAASDVYRLVEPEVIIDRYKNQPKTDSSIVILELLRNCLIFAPLVVTWLGISQAVTKYNALIASDHNQIYQPFLYLWQNGFGDRLAGWQTLGSLALIDFSLLFLVLALTIIVYSLSSTIKLKRERAAAELRSSLADALAGAVLCLRTRNWQQPTDFVARFDDTAKTFKQAIEHLVGRMEALAQLQQKDHQTFNDFRQDLATIMGGVSKSVGELKDTDEALRRSIVALTKPTDTVATNLAPLSTSAQEAVNLHKTEIEGLRILLQSLTTWGTNLQSVLSKLDAAVVTAIDMTNGVKGFTDTEKDLIKQLEQERVSQAEISSRMIIVTDRLGHVVPALDEVVRELNAVNVQLYDVARRVATMMGARVAP